jgi:tetratricopeptide (TPR) repeat protein
MKNSFILPLLLGTVALWSSSVYLSSYLAETKLPPNHAASNLAERDNTQTTPSSTPSSEVIAKLEESLKQLQADPNNIDALLELANISFEGGVFDKAVDYLERAAKLIPETDSRFEKVNTDIALASLQLGRTERSIAILEKLLTKNSELFPARLALALSLKMNKQIEEATKVANIALAKAPDEEAKAVVNRFLAEINNPITPPSKEDTPLPPLKSNISPEEMSPGILVQSFFKNHPIIGPKVKSITWSDAQTAVISLADFPVEAMPPFAKAKLETSIQETFAKLSEKITIKLVDDGTKQTLIEYLVGQ